MKLAFMHGPGLVLQCKDISVCEIVYADQCMGMQISVCECIWKSVYECMCR